MRKRPVFGVIFLLTGLGLFGYLLLRSLLTEVGPPPGAPPAMALQTTNQEPFREFDVVKWLGWALVAAALAEVGAAYLHRRDAALER